MKLFLALLIVATGITVSSSSLQAQDLEFSRVINYNFGDSNPLVIPFTVPAGKVWKLTSAGTGTSSSSGIYLQDDNGYRVLTLGGSSGENAKFPIWFQEGYSGSFERSFNTTSGGGFVSIIEFSVLP